MGLADDFEAALWDLVDEWEAAGISPGRIPMRIDALGAVEAAERYTRGPQTRGFGLAYQRLGPDKTLEGLVAAETYASLFDRVTRHAALAKLGTDPDEEEIEEPRRPEYSFESELGFDAEAMDDWGDRPVDYD